MKSHRPIAVLGAAAAVLTCGCTGISSFHDPVDGPRNGMTYYLPKTEFRVTFTVSRDPKAAAKAAAARKEEGDDATPNPAEGTTPSALEDQQTSILTACDPVFVADRSAGAFTMHSSANEFFKRDHKLKMDHGLLTSVSMSDEGRIVQIVDRLGDVAVMAITGAPPPDKIKEPGTKGADGDAAGGDQDLAAALPDFPELEEFPVYDGRRPLRPNRDEISKILLQITEGQYAVHMAGNGTEYRMPGTSGRIRAACSRANLPPGSSSSKSAWHEDIPSIPARNCGIMPGIAVRNSTRAGVLVKLQADEGMAAELRAATANRNLKKLRNYQKDLDDVEANYEEQKKNNDNNLARARNKIIEGESSKFKFPSNATGEASYEAEEAHLQKAMNLISARKAKALAAIAEQQTAATTYGNITRSSTPMTLQEHTMKVTATIDERVVVIPLTRGPVGTTEHTVTLKDGVVGEWSFTKPSAIEGLVEIPVEIAKDVVRIPAAAFETKTSEIKAKNDLIKAQDQLIQDQTKLLENRKKLQEAQKKPEKEEEGGEEGGGAAGDGEVLPENKE